MRLHEATEGRAIPRGTSGEGEFQNLQSESDRRKVEVLKGFKRRNLEHLRVPKLVSRIETRNLGRFLRV